MAESKFSAQRLAAFLAESERFPEIVRDDAFWLSLESMPADAQTVAIRDRFMRLITNEPSELHI